ncbi:MAG: hypothetical protein IJX26_00325, partial [Clostridia bacterium]|nr:hypothetical protein [Clostridia bacterium]
RDKMGKAAEKTASISNKAFGLYGAYLGGANNAGPNATKAQKFGMGLRSAFSTTELGKKVGGIDFAKGLDDGRKSGKTHAQNVRQRAIDMSRDGKTPRADFAKAKFYIEENKDKVQKAATTAGSALSGSDQTKAENAYYANTDVAKALEAKGSFWDGSKAVKFSDFKLQVEAQKNKNEKLRAKKIKLSEFNDARSDAKELYAELKNAFGVDLADVTDYLTTGIMPPTITSRDDKDAIIDRISKIKTLESRAKSLAYDAFEAYEGLGGSHAVDILTALSGSTDPNVVYNEMLNKGAINSLENYSVSDEVDSIVGTTTVTINDAAKVIDQMEKDYQEHLVRETKNAYGIGIPSGDAGTIEQNRKDIAGELSKK